MYRVVHSGTITCAVAVSVSCRAFRNDKNKNLTAITYEPHLQFMAKAEPSVLTNPQKFTKQYLHVMNIHIYSTHHHQFQNEMLGSQCPQWQVSSCSVAVCGGEEGGGEWGR